MKTKTERIVKKKINQVNNLIIIADIVPFGDYFVNVSCRKLLTDKKKELVKSYIGKFKDLIRELNSKL